MLIVATGFLSACENEDEYGDCIEGLIPAGTLYKALYPGCYEHWLLIEIVNRDHPSNDIEIYTPSPTGIAMEPVRYANVVQAVLPCFWKNSDRRDTLMGKRFYLEYRLATPEEIESATNGDCADVYQVHSAPAIVVTNFSFNGCGDLRVPRMHVEEPSAQ